MTVIINGVTDNKLIRSLSSYVKNKIKAYIESQLAFGKEADMELYPEEMEYASKTESVLLNS